MKRKLLMLIIALTLLVIVGFAPPFQGVQRFKTIIAETIRSDDVTVNDDLVVGDDASITGDLSVTGGFAPSGGGSFVPGVIISAPTAVGTATPALQVINAGVSNPAEFRLNLTATPYLIINPTAGARVNNAIIGGAVGKKWVCVTQTITGTGTVSHGLATPDAAVCSLAANPVGDNWCTYTNAAGVVTAKVWTGLLGTPTAASDGVSVTTCVLGSP